MTIMTSAGLARATLHGRWTARLPSDRIHQWYRPRHRHCAGGIRRDDRDQRLRRSAEIENLCQVLGARHDVPVRYDDADMSKPTAIRDMVERVGRSFGPVDILVNNAGIQHVAPLEQFPPSGDAILAINLSAAFHATRAVLPEMKRRGFGRIVNVASAHGLIGFAVQVGLCRSQARYRRPDQGCGAGGRRIRRDLQRGVPWLCLDTAGREAGGRSGKAHGISRDAVICEVFLAEQPTKRFATVEEVAGTPCSSAASSRLRSRHCIADRWRLGRRTDMASSAPTAWCSTALARACGIGRPPWPVSCARRPCCSAGGGASEPPE